jgi:hypothetical protein
MKSEPKILTPPRIMRQTPKSGGDHQEQIRHLAYQLYEQRGTVDGFALDDWLQAEAEVLRAQRQPKVKSAKTAK